MREKLTFKEEFAKKVAGSWKSRKLKWLYRTIFIYYNMYI
ncbi:hypothetical protein X953_16275 [Virgibacillus sp. SK37]|nr:hypothetical protein X953_16275 [Virgibacillus sp. SK37]